MRDRLTLVQGPPGTGKTRVLAGIVTNWYKQSISQSRSEAEVDCILVCCPQNHAADLCAQVLAEVPMIQGHVLRIKNSKRENIFNIDDVTLLKPYQLIYKMLNMDQRQRNQMSQDIFLSSNPRRFKLRYQVEFYFGDYNYPTDWNLQSCADPQGWIRAPLILDFHRMRELSAS